MSCSNKKGIVINVRGINASGKSTAVREFCRLYSLEPKKIPFMGYKYKIMTDGKKYVIGWYKPYSNSEGCDPLNVSKEHFKLFLKYLMKDLRPEVIVYEKQIWSTTYKLTSEIRQIVEDSSYTFLVIQMSISYADGLNNLFIRNKKDTTCFKNYNNRFYSVNNSVKKLKKHKANIMFVDFIRVPFSEMKYVIPKCIDFIEGGGNCGLIPNSKR